VDTAQAYAWAVFLVQLQLQFLYKKEKSYKQKNDISLQSPFNCQTIFKNHQNAIPQPKNYGKFYNKALKYTIFIVIINKIQKIHLFCLLFIK
jgi:hypothetical protein